LRSKTTDNGCTEAEALLAAVKVAELLDRYDLSLTDVEIRNAQCEQREYETPRKKRIGAVAMCVGICWRGLRWDEDTGSGSQVNRLFSKVLV
jgi:hypothetical protein